MVRSSLFVSLLAAASTAVAAADNRRARENKRLQWAQVPGAYIVEFEEGHDHHAFRRQAEPQAEYDTRLDLNYELFHGVSIQLHDIQSAEDKARQLASLPSVKKISPVRLFERPHPTWQGDDKASSHSIGRSKRQAAHSAKSHVAKRQGNGTVDAYSTHVMTQVDRVHAEGITGAGIRIAVVDSGVDYTHPALGGCFGEGCLVVSGYDFVGDDYDGTTVPMPDDNPMDCDGHGTHVAGIIAAQENDRGILGAAPGATLSAYRVFGCYGFTGNDVLIASFNQAYEDGADIISASIGGSPGWSGDPWAVAVSRIVERGVPCILAAGNSGEWGLWLAETASAGKGVTSVASFDNTQLPAYLFESYKTIDNSTQTAFTYDWGFPVWEDDTTRAVWVTGYDTNNTADACQPLPDDTPDLSEYNVLLRRSIECDEAEQAFNVAAKGARWLTIYNNRPSIEWFDASFVEGIEGVISISEDEGISWVEALKAGSQVYTNIVYYEESERVLYTSENPLSPGAVSSFSSHGPTFEMDVKPQFGAPGGNILSTIPLTYGGYGIASGTSMATPFIAASFALVMEARGRLTPAEIESFLASNANPQLYLDKRTDPFTWKEWLTSPAQQGAGLIQVYDAIHATTLLEPASLSFNDTANFAGTLNFTLSNTDSEEIVYTFSHVPTRTLYSLYEDKSQQVAPIENTEAHAEIDFSESKVSLAPGESVTIAVTATPPRGVDESRYPLWTGYIAINGSDGTSLSLSYQGLSGSLYDADYISDQGLLIVDSRDYPFVPVPPNVTLTFPPPGVPVGVYDPYENPVPGIVLDLRWGSPKVFADVIPLMTCAPNATINAIGQRSLGQLPGYPLEWAPRDSIEFLWSGDLDNGDYVPAGRYKIVMRILRIFGDEDDEDDWIVTESNPFRAIYAE